LSDQLYDFENLVYELKMKRVEQSASVYVASRIKKLPPSLSKFAKGL